MESQARQLAHIGGNLADTCSHWRKYWSIAWDEGLASQDDAQEVQVWSHSDTVGSYSTTYLDMAWKLKYRCKACGYEAEVYEGRGLFRQKSTELTSSRSVIISQFDNQ